MEKIICIEIQQTEEGFYAFDVNYEPADSEGIGGGTFAFAATAEQAVADLLEVA